MSASELVFGSYLLTRRVPPPARDASLLPPQLVTTSGCLVPFFPDIWAFSSEPEMPGRAEERAEWTRMLGLATPTSAEPLCLTMLESRELLWPRFIQSDAAVRTFLSAIRPTFEPIVLGLALHRDLVPRFAEESSVGENDDQTLVGALRKDKPPPSGGVMLGFEPLGFEYGASDAHSWVCNELERTFLERTHAKPNAHGLIDDVELARTFCDDVTREELGEPLLWLPWALIDYSRAFGLSGVP